MMTRRQILGLVALSVVGTSTTPAAWAQSVKTTTVTLTIEGMT